MSFSKSKSKTSGSQTGTSTTTADPASLARYQQQSNDILGALGNYTSKPYETYTKPMVAGLSTNQIKARDLAGSNVGSWEGILGDAEGAAKSGLSYDAADPSKYYNKFENDVISSTGAYFDEELERQLNQQADSVAQRGAFGNVSRDLGEAELRRGATMDKAKAMADLKYSGYRDAVDTGFKQQAGQYQGAGILGNLATQKQQLGQSDVAMMEQLGATEHELAQAQLLADRAEFDKAAADELNKLMLELQTRSGILASNPFGTSTTSSGSSTGTSSGTQFGASIGFGPKGFAIGG